jgi:hypothetical protein
MADKNVEEIVLYHGSLAELNSRDPNKQYRFVDTRSYVTRLYLGNESLEGIKRELSEKGFI